MGTSQSLSHVPKGEKTATLCKLCEKEPDIKWKCVECGLKMCQRCREKVHAKFPSAQNHTVIDIKGIKEQPKNPEEKSIEFRLKCSVHSEEMCCIYCKTCQNCVCQKCVTVTHNKHDFSDIKDFYESKLNVIRRQHKTILAKTRCLFEKEQELKTIQSAEQIKHEKIKKEILDYNQAVIDDVQKQTEKLLEQLEQKWHSTLKDIRENKINVKQELEQLHQVKNEIGRVIQPSNANDMLAVPRFFIERINITKEEINSVFREVPNFINGNIGKISSLYGYLEDFPLMPKIKMEVEKRLHTKLNGNINKIAVCSDGSLWLSEDLSETLQRVEPDGETVNILSSFNIYVLDMVLLPSGDLLLSISNSSNLKIISLDSQQAIKDSIYTVTPFETGALHVTFDNRVIIAAWTHCGEIRSGEKLVIIMDEKGNKEKVFKNDSNNEPLFQCPHYISSNKLRNMAILDMVSFDHDGQIVVLNKEGSVRNIYRGHSTVNKRNEFKPRGIISTQLNNFIISESFSHTLHILNSEGAILTFCDTGDVGVAFPYSLCFSEEGRLYIGCGFWEEIDTVKIYIVKNFNL